MIRLIIAALLPVGAAIGLYFLNNTTFFSKISEGKKQIIYGIVFGILAILGTEYGIPMNGAQVNCRDASVMTAGLLFGAPAGIIAGLIGGIERWIAVAWGIGTFTRTACTISTIMAGFFTAFLRKHMFEDQKPTWILSLASGFIIEVFHMSMVFITNMHVPLQALEVVRACTLPMVTANGLSTMIATLALQLISGTVHVKKVEQPHISQSIQRKLFLTVLAAFVVTSLFVYQLQTSIAKNETDSTLERSIDEIIADIHDAADKNMIDVCRTIEKELTLDGLHSTALRHNVSEINVVNKDGVIVESTTPEFVGYDMNSGSQSAEFMCLLKDTHEFIQEYAPISYDVTVWRKYAGVSTADGFLQIGFDAEQSKQSIDTQVQGITKNRHVSTNGFIFIADAKLDIVSAPDEMEPEMISRFSHEMMSRPSQRTNKQEIDGTTYYCRYDKMEGYFVVAVLPETEAMQMRNMVIYSNTFMEVFVFGIMFAVIYLLLKRVVVDQILKINKSLTIITGGNLNEVVDVRTNQEFASLSDDINSTVNTLKGYIAEEAARIDKELTFARNIQMSALPKVESFPKRKSFDIFADMDPAKEVGGDFYDFYYSHENTLNFLVADVSGKGIPGAMFMMRAKTELKSQTDADLPLSEVFTRGNAALCEGNDAGMFVTAWQGSLDLKTGRVTFANAGHNPPLVRHQNGQFEYLRSKVGFVLAGMEGVRYKEQELQLEKGDILYLYTDGVPEATNAKEVLYGDERLKAAINSHEFTSMKELCEYIKNDVNRFVGDAPQFDDMTMVAIRYFGE